MTTTMDAADLRRVPPAIDAVARGSEDPEAGHELFDVWLVLPVQLAGGARAAERSGEKRLLAALLADAMRLYAKHRHSRTASGVILFRETERWIESCDRSWLLAFENVCNILDIEPERLRRTLRTETALGERGCLPVDAGRLRVGRRRKIRV
jgi:hypothetical protein